MNDLFDLLIHLYNHDIVKILIKNDCVVYGKIIRDSLNTSITCLDSVIINAVSPSIFRTIIERDLYKYIKKKTIIRNTDYKKNLYIYDCVLNNKKIFLEIFYIPEINIDKISNIRDFVLFDVDLVSISRNGVSLMYIPNNDLEIPNPMLNILNKIKKKQFDIIGKIKHNFDLNLVLNMIKSGWKNLSSSAKIKKNTTFLNKKCTICMENFKNSDIILELKCCHFFHRKCWLENIFQSIEISSCKIKCPMCRQDNLFREIIC